MIGVLCFALAVLASPFKSKLRLDREDNGRWRVSVKDTNDGGLVTVSAKFVFKRVCNGKPLCRPSQPPHEYGPGIRPKDATDKEARTPRSRGRSVVVLYNGVRTHRSLNKDAPVSRPVQRSGFISSHAILGGLHHHYARV
jgi:hypothetical protein